MSGWKMAPIAVEGGFVDNEKEAEAVCRAIIAAPVACRRGAGAAG